MVEFEEMGIVDGFVTIFDEDGMITIQMEKKYVEEIMDNFDPYVQGKLFMSTEFYIDKQILKLDLINFGDTFNLNGRMYGDLKSIGSYYHDFELEDCNIKTWNKIYKFIKK